MYASEIWIDAESTNQFLLKFECGQLPLASVSLDINFLPAGGKKQCTSNGWDTHFNDIQVINWDSTIANWVKVNPIRCWGYRGNDLMKPLRDDSS